MNYHVKEGSTIKQVGDGANDFELLANFHARIIKETIIIDGMNEKTVFTIEGASKKRKFKTIEVPAEKFASMSWITQNWGARAVIMPTSNATTELRTAIQLASEDAEVEFIYQHTGWTEIDGKPAYLHCNGAITDGGNDESVKVEMPADLRHYSLPTVMSLPGDGDGKDCFWASVQLVTLAEQTKVVPLLLATWRACIDDADFAVHCTGRSGSFKSEVTSLMQSHYGDGMDARHLPGSWNSTANALEALAFRAKNAIFVIDDFIPVGTSWQQKQYQGNADRIMRAQGNQQGRARLTDVSSLQQTMYPRGLVMSSGEDTPEGQSLRGRMMIVELSKGDVSPDKLTECQARRSMLPRCLARFIRWLATDREEKIERFNQSRLRWRDTCRGHGHARTPQMVGDLMAGAELFFEFGRSYNYVDEEDSVTWLKCFEESLIATAIDQTRFIVESDPSDNFLKVLQASLMGKRVHLAAIDGGSPDEATAMGWTEDRSGASYHFKPKGTRIGWVDVDKNEIYLEHGIGYEELKKQSGGQISVTASTLWKRLRESGVIVKTDVKRQRSTVRMVAEKTTRTVVVIALDRVIQISEDEEDVTPF